MTIPEPLMAIVRLVLNKSPIKRERLSLVSVRTAVITPGQEMDGGTSPVLAAVFLKSDPHELLELTAHCDSKNGCLTYQLETR